MAINLGIRGKTQSMMDFLVVVRFQDPWVLQVLQRVPQMNTISIGAMRHISPLVLSRYKLFSIFFITSLVSFSFKFLLISNESLRVYVSELALLTQLLINRPIQVMFYL